MQNHLPRRRTDGTGSGTAQIAAAVQVHAAALPAGVNGAACAAVAAAVLNGHCKRGEEITVKLKCGNLMITYAENSHIYMRGAAEKVYDGVYEL